MSRHFKAWMIIIITFVLTGCALNDMPSGTASPPVTVLPPPALVFEGECTTTKTLETWLQVTTQLVGQFQSGMNETITRNRASIYTDIQNLIALRDAAYSVTTPDCASDTQLILTDSMNKAVTAFQDYFNGTQADINATLVSLNEQFDQISIQQATLLEQMSAQFQSQAPTPTPG